MGAGGTAAAPGKDEKKVVYGGVSYKPGKLTYTLDGIKSGAAFILFLIALATAYAGRMIRLVCDNGRFHTRSGWPNTAITSKSTGFPSYSPSLNLIERLWGHLKRTMLANVLYQSLDDLVVAFRKGVTRITGNRDHMGFMFDHDDLTQEILALDRKRAA